MDPRDRADAALARARARRRYIVTPDNAVSPMDASNTQQLPRVVIDRADDARAAEQTSSMPAPRPRGETPPPRERVEPAEPSDHPLSEPSTTEPLPAGAKAYRQDGPQGRARGRRPGIVAVEPDAATDDADAMRPAEQHDGLVPTVQQQQRTKKTLFQRLSGE